MNRLPPTQLEQGNHQATYCDMNYQLDHPFHRMDQPQQRQQQQQQQQQHHHRQQQHHNHHLQQLQQQPPMYTVRRSAFSNGGIVGPYGHPHHHYHSNSKSSSSSSGGNNRVTSSNNNSGGRHIYEQYPQQVSTSNHHMYPISNRQQSNCEPSPGLYHMAPIRDNHENVAFIPNQTNYGSHIHSHIQQEPMQTTSQLYNNSVPLTRVAPHMHHNQHSQQQHEQYHYNDGIVMQQQEHQLYHQMHSHQHQQEDYLVPNQMYDQLQGVQQQHQHHHHQQQHPVVSVAESLDYDVAVGDLIDQNQVYYQQEQMDSLPTIKQQQQMQQQQLHLRQQNLRVDTSPISPTLPQQPQTTQIVSRMKPEMATSANTDLDSQQQQRIRANQHQDSSSTTSYLANNRNQQQQPQQQQQQQQQSQMYRNQRQRVSSPIDCNKSNSVHAASSSTSRGGQQLEEFVDLRSCGSVSQDWLDTICRHLIDHMNRFGICVIDNFLGNLKGDLILKEVQQLYNSGQYSRGMLVSSKLNTKPPLAEGRGVNGGGSSEETGTASAAIRNDRVIWIDGYEDGCSEINNLIQTLCSVITNSSRLSLYSNNGLDKIVINKRTKAHVACYPGNGTRYIKHVDNPNDDGRVITSIYYLNKDWNTKRDGGLLRMFPVGMDEVANIEPLFDRVLFFWSDRRNPHEVLPAYRDRFAITVWYIGANREQPT